MDEFKVHFYDSETKKKSIEWRHSGFPRLKKFSVKKTARKVVT